MQKSEVRGQKSEEEEEDDDPRLTPYLANARGVVDMVACIAAWRLKRLAHRLRMLRR